MFEGAAPSLDRQISILCGFVHLNRHKLGIWGGGGRGRPYMIFLVPSKYELACFSRQMFSCQREHVKSYSFS